MKSNNFFQRASAIVLAASLLAPSVVSAQTRLDASASVGADIRARVCTALSERLQLLEARYSEVKTRLETNRDAQKDRLQVLRNQRMDRVAEREDAADLHRDEQYARLEAFAKTDAQKSAVVAFQAEVDAAVAARRQAFDAANETYKTQVNDATENWKTSASDGVSNFRAAVRTAVNTALAGCKSGEDAESVRTAFEADLQAARIQFANDRKNLDRVGDQVREYAHSRNEALAAAMTDFKAALEAARTALKAAFAAEASAEGT